MTEHLDHCGGQSEVVSGSLFIRKVVLRTQGESVGKHVHNFDHTTFFMRGRVVVRVTAPDGSVRELVAEPGDYLLIGKDNVHELTALDSDGALFMCVYSHRDREGRVTEQFDSIHATQ